MVGKLRFHLQSGSVVSGGSQGCWAVSADGLNVGGSGIAISMHPGLPPPLFSWGLQKGTVGPDRKCSNFPFLLSLCTIPMSSSFQSD